MLIRGISVMVILELKTTLQSEAKVQPKKKKFNPEAPVKVWPTDHRITGFTHIPKLSSQRFHLGEERNCRPLRSLEDIVVGWGHAEPWAHMDEKQGWWGGGGQV